MRARSGNAGPGKAERTAIAWSVLAATLRRAALIWLLVRLFLAVALGGPPGGSFTPHLGTVRTSAVAVGVTTLLVLYDARRMNERVLAEDLGLPELTIGLTTALCAVMCELALLAARSALPIS